MSDTFSFSRRQVLATSALAPAFLRGAAKELKFGAIAVGNRGRYLHQTFQKLGARCAAVCDTYEPFLERGAKDSAEGVKRYADYRQVLDQKDLDFVMIASPDHHHYPMLRDALAAGKDVYLEKPLSLNLEESELMKGLAAKSDRVIQIGMQRRSMGFIRKAKQMVDDGALGKVSMVKAIWNWHFALPLNNEPLEGKLDWERFQGTAPRRALEPRRFRWWRGFWDYSGGNITDQGTHLMDVVQWMTGNQAPLSASCQGAVVEADGAEVPNVFSTTYIYPNLVATWTLNYRSAYNNDWSIEFYGEKAAMKMDRTGYKIFKDPGESRNPWSSPSNLEIISQEPDKEGQQVHLQNFLDCVASRQQPNCTVDIAANAVAGPHMANLSYRSGQVYRRKA